MEHSVQMTSLPRAVASALGLAFVAAAIIGFITFIVAYEILPTENDPWAELTAAYYGIMAGLIGGAIAYVVLGFTLIRKKAPADRRSAILVAYYATPVLTVFLPSTLWAIAEALS